MSDLKERVNAFNLMQLPGQSTMMHMGTFYLVNDLWSEVFQLRAEVERLKEANGLLSLVLSTRLKKEKGDNL